MSGPLDEAFIGALCAFVIGCLAILVFLLPGKFDELHDHLDRIEAGVHCPAPPEESQPTPTDSTEPSDAS